MTPGQQAKREARKSDFKLMKAYVKLYKAYYPCVDCGTKENLTFDHVRGVKFREVGRCGSWTTMVREIAKCEIRCRPCHDVIEKKRHDKRVLLKKMKAYMEELGQEEFNKLLEQIK